MKSRLFYFPIRQNDGTRRSSPYGLHPVFWIDGSRVNSVMRPAWGSDSWRGTDETRLSAEAMSDILRFITAWEKAIEVLAWIAKSQGDLIYLDMEHIPHVLSNDAVDYRFAVQAAKILKRVCPAIKLTCYDAKVADLVNNDWIIAYDNGTLGTVLSAGIKASAAKYREFNDLLDLLDLPTYLLGESYYDRDMAMFAALRRIYRRLYPHKPLICSAWGRYHDVWNKTPDKYTVAPRWLSAYANLLTRYGDDVIVFDEESPRDDAWMGLLKERSEG